MPPPAVRLRERPVQAVAIVAAGVVALVISCTVPADDVPTAYYSAVSAVIPLLLIALFTAFGRDRADVLDISREVDRVSDLSQEAAERFAIYREPIHARGIRRSRSATTFSSSAKRSRRLSKLVLRV
ncbi:MAG: hypothetical protein K0Q89_2992 [Thermomicrobiales bacterium]|jgi:hypothetical protein|nr:hypothetical protein [Thermomicrobiales bacterium]